MCRRSQGQEFKRGRESTLKVLVTINADTVSYLELAEANALGAPGIRLSPNANGKERYGAAGGVEWEWSGEAQWTLCKCYRFLFLFLSQCTLYLSLSSLRTLFVLSLSVFSLSLFCRAEKTKESFSVSLIAL